MSGSALAFSEDQMDSSGSPTINRDSTNSAVILTFESSGSTTYKKGETAPVREGEAEPPKSPTSNRLTSAFPSVSVSPLPKKHSCLKITQEFDGVVTKIDVAAREFEAELTDITHEGNPREIIVVSIDDISPLDQELVREGALFRWTLGRKTIVDGMPSNEGYDRFTFRRIPNWSKARIDDASKQARSLLESLCR